GIDGKTADLPIQADRAQAVGRRDLIVDDVVEFELAAGGVAQRHVGRGPLPLCSDCANLAGWRTKPAIPNYISSPNRPPQPSEFRSAVRALLVPGPRHWSRLACG